MKCFCKVGTLLGIALAVVAIGSSQAQAAFKLRLSDGTNTVTLTDQVFTGSGFNTATGVGVGTAGDFNATAGVILYSGAVGNFFVNASLGTGDPVTPNTPYEATMHLNNISLSSTAGGTLTVELTQTGLSLGTGPSIAMTSSLGGLTQGKVHAKQILDLNNQEFATAGAIVLDHGNLSGPAFSGTISGTTSYVANQLFSLTERAVIVHKGGSIQQTSFDLDSVAAVPAPPAIILCLSGLPMFVGAWWSRRRSTAKLSA